MSLSEAVNRAQLAASHARPFLKLIESLGALESELKGVGKLQADADAVAAKKNALEADIPKLQSTHDSLSKAVASLKAVHATTQSDFEKGIALQQKQADADLEAKHAAVKAEHEKTISELKAQIATLKAEKDAIEKQKTDMQAIIDQQRQSFSKAAAALHA